MSGDRPNVLLVMTEIRSLPRMYHVAIAGEVDVIYECGEANAEGVSD